MPGFFGALAAVGGVSGVSIVGTPYFNYNSASSVSNAYTWTGLTFAAHSHLILMAGVRAAAARTFSDFQAGGSSGTFIVGQNSIGEDVEIWIIPHTSTSSFDVTLTASGSCVGAGLCVIAVSGLLSTTPTVTPVTDTGDPISVSTDITAGAIVVAAGVTNDVLGCTWTGIDELGDDGESTAAFSAAARVFTSAQTGYSVTADWSTNPSRAEGVCAVFR